MNKLILHHTYAQGMAFDISDHRNHGRTADVTPGVDDYVGTVRFDQPTSRVQVAPSPSLARLHAVWARVRFHLSSPGPGRRQNLVEGFISFVLAVEPDGALGGGIVDATGNWNGVRSAPGLVTLDEWHEAELRHDGVSQCVILLDGTPVAESAAIPGPVRAVGDLGLAIGTWPDQDNVFTLQGHIDEVQVYGYDPVEDVKKYLDPCCLDVRPIRQAAGRLQEQGWDAERLGQLVGRLVQLGNELAQAVRGGDPARTAEHQQGLTELMDAFRRRDPAALRAALRRVADLTRTSLPPQELADRTREWVRLLQEVPLRPQEVEALATSLCWQHAIIRDPRRLLNPDR